MLKIRVSLIAVCLALAGCDSLGRSDAPQVPEGRFPSTERDDLPVVLTGKRLGAREALAPGELIRRGSCFQLGSGPEEAVIVWEEGARIDATSERGFAIVLPSGLRVAEGDRLRGEGGNLPPDRPIADFTNELVPDECAIGDAVQLHSIEIVETVRKDDPGAPPASITTPRAFLPRHRRKSRPRWRSGSESRSRC